MADADDAELPIHDTSRPHHAEELVGQPPQDDTAAAAARAEEDHHELSLSGRGLAAVTLDDLHFAGEVRLRFELLRRLDLSRNSLTELDAAAIGAVPALEVRRCKLTHQLHPMLNALGFFNSLKVHPFQAIDFQNINTHLYMEVLDVSRNKLRELPAALATLRRLRELHALSNSLRPAARSVPLEALAALPSLAVLDLRYNPKLRGSAGELAAALPSCDVRLTLEAKVRRCRLTPPSG